MLPPFAPLVHGNHITMLSSYALHQLLGTVSVFLSESPSAGKVALSETSLRKPFGRAAAPVRRPAGPALPHRGLWSLARFCHPGPAAAGSRGRTSSSPKVAGRGSWPPTFAALRGRTAPDESNPGGNPAPGHWPGSWNGVRQPETTPSAQE